MSKPRRRWHHQDILAAVRKRDSSLRQLSLANGLGPSTLQASLYKRHPRANKIIADFLGVTCHAIWPAWYGANDELLAHPKVRRARKRRGSTTRGRPCRA